MRGGATFSLPSQLTGSQKQGQVPVQHRCQFSGPTPSAKHSLGSGSLLPRGKSKGETVPLLINCLNNNWTHLVLPHLFFTVNFTNATHGHRHPVCPPTRATLAALFPRSLLTDILPGPLQFVLQEDLYPSSWHKAQPDPGPSAALGKLVWMTWLWVKVCEQGVLNKNSVCCPCSCLPLPS